MSEPEVKPLPCPFCGGEPTSAGRPTSSGVKEPYFHFVACYCGGHSACAHKIGLGDTPEQAERNALAEWNKRDTTEVDRLRARVAELEALCDLSFANGIHAGWNCETAEERDAMAENARRPAMDVLRAQKEQGNG